MGTLLNNTGDEGHIFRMKHLILSMGIALLAAQTASAECYADYKAKRDDPLRLHYGVAELLGTCDAEAAASELTPRLAGDDWQLLNIVGVFDETGLEERQESAGEFYLRY